MDNTESRVTEDGSRAEDAGRSGDAPEQILAVPALGSLTDTEAAILDVLASMDRAIGELAYSHGINVGDIGENIDRLALAFRASPERSEAGQ